MTRNRLIASVTLACLLYIGCFVGAAQAQSGQSATLSWVLPDSYEDGSALNPATDLTEIRVYHNGTLVQSVAGTATNAIVANLPYGTNEFYVTALAVNGQESVMSNTDTKVVLDTRRPRPPTLIQVVIAWLRSFFGRFV